MRDKPANPIKYNTSKYEGKVTWIDVVQAITYIGFAIFLYYMTKE